MHNPASYSWLFVFFVRVFYLMLNFSDEFMAFFKAGIGKTTNIVNEGKGGKNSHWRFNEMLKHLFKCFFAIFHYKFQKFISENHTNILSYSLIALINHYIHTLLKVKEPLYLNASFN